jgi:hypothetical protein
MRNRRLARCLVYPVFLLATLPGCQALHAYRPVTVLACDAETKKPIPGAEVRISYPLAQSPPWEPVGTTSSDGTVQLKAAPYGDAGILVDAVRSGYMTEQKGFPVDAVKAVSPFRFFSGGSHAPDLVVEMYAEPLPEVELMLPDGYRGTLKVAVKVRDDAPFQPGQRQFSYEVPPSGVLEIVGPPLLRHVYTPDFSARYSRSKNPSLPRQPEGDQVGFWCLKTEGGFDHFFVGTRAEFEALRRADKEDGKVKTTGGGGRSGGGRGGRHGGGGGQSSSDSGQSSMSPQ